jgi:hypothetical protein
VTRSGACQVSRIHEAEQQLAARRPPAPVAHAHCLPNHPSGQGGREVITRSRGVARRCPDLLRCRPMSSCRVCGVDDDHARAADIGDASADSTQRPMLRASLRARNHDSRRPGASGLAASADSSSMRAREDRARSRRFVTIGPRIPRRGAS